MNEVSVGDGKGASRRGGIHPLIIEGYGAKRTCDKAQTSKM